MFSSCGHCAVVSMFQINGEDASSVGCVNQTQLFQVSYQMFSSVQTGYSFQVLTS